MTLVKSHVCASCGGQLKVHEDRQLYECSFCGATYNYEFFQLRDLQELADRSLKAMEFPSALKKFKFILTKDPHNFEGLRGQVLCAAKVRSFDSFANLTTSYKGDLESVEKEIVFAKENALEEDKKFFERFSEMVKLADEYKEITAKVKEYERALKQEDDKVKEMEAYSLFVSNAPATIIMIAMGVGSLIFRQVLGFAFWVVLLVFIVLGFGIYMIVATKSRKMQLAHHRQMRSENKSKCDEYTAKAKEYRENIASIYNELKAMKPIEPEQETKDVKVSSEKMRKGACPNCGGELIINLDRNVYECLFCGMTLDYEYVRDENVYTSAIKAMKNDQFAEADDLFERMLKTAPSDPNALLGRIMCAGKLNNVGTFRSLCNETILLNVMKTRTKEAINATEGEDKEYFGKIAEILENYEKYRAEASRENSIDAKISSVRKEQETFERFKSTDDNRAYYYDTNGELKDFDMNEWYIRNSDGGQTDRERMERAMGRRETAKLLNNKMDEVRHQKEKHSKAASVFRKRIEELYDEMRQIRPHPLAELVTTDNK